MTHEKAVEKIKKLIALSDSPNENEAALAASKARELLDRYNLKMSDLREEADNTPGHESEIICRSRYEQWMLVLITSMGRTFDVYPLSRRKLAPRTKGGYDIYTAYSAIGYESDVELFIYTYNVVANAIEKLFQDDLKRAKEEGLVKNRRESHMWRRSFCLGAAARICKKVEDMRNERLSADVATRDLVIARRHTVENWVKENMNLGTGKQNYFSYTTAKGFHRGYARGDEIDINPGINE